MRISEYLENKNFSGKIVVGGTMKNGIPVAIFALINSEDRDSIFKLSGDVLSVESLSSDKAFEASFSSGSKRIYSSSDIGASIKCSLDSGKTLLEAFDELKTPGMAVVLDKDKYSIGIFSIDADGNENRTVWNYPNILGFGHIAIACDTCKCCPAFESDPALVRLDDSLVSLGENLWSSLDDKSKVALYIGSENGGRVFNKNIW